MKLHLTSEELTTIANESAVRNINRLNANREQKHTERIQVTLNLFLTHQQITKNTKISKNINQKALAKHNKQQSHLINRFRLTNLE